MMQDLIRRTRTVRRYEEERPLEEGLLRNLVDMARLGGSARNAQSLKYGVITEKKLRDQLFPLLAWAGYLPHWPGPQEGERPSAYVVCLLDSALQKGPETEAHFDLGIATQNMLLTAAEQGVFGCRIGAFSPAKVQEFLRLPEQFKPLLVVALGYPREDVVLEEIGENGDIRYWHDDQGVHHVPKRKLDDLLVDLSKMAKE